MRLKPKPSDTVTISSGAVHEQKTGHRIASIGVDWTHPDVTKLPMRYDTSILGYDAVILNPSNWFQELAVHFVRDSVWENEGMSETRFENGQALRAAVSEFAKQIYTLCTHGGVVAVLATPTYSVKYSTDSLDIQRMAQLVHSPRSMVYVTSMEPFFGKIIEQYRGILWKQTELSGNGSASVIRRTIWDAYLEESLAWSVTLDLLPESYDAIATIPVRNQSSSQVIAAVRSVALGQIAILPHPAEREAQDTLIDCIRDALEGPKVPDWAASVQMRPIEHLQNEIEKLALRIEEIQKDIRTIEQYKALLYGVGDELENTVGMAFGLLGLAPQKPDSSGVEDWIISLSGDQLGVCEVTGSDGIIPKKKASQLLGWNNKYPGHKGILVVNPCRMMAPREREGLPDEQLISPHAIKECENNGIAILFTSTLFDMVCEQLEGKDSGTELAKLLATTIGVVEQ